VELLPPAPAARVLEGRALATLSARSAAARRRMAVAGPPGGLGEAGRAVVLPEAAGETGESEDWEEFLVVARFQVGVVLRELEVLIACVEVAYHCEGACQRLCCDCFVLAEVRFWSTLLFRFV
jgi:hypothetical protein